MMVQNSFELGDSKQFGRTQTESTAGRWWKLGLPEASRAQLYCTLCAESSTVLALELARIALVFLNFWLHGAIACMRDMCILKSQNILIQDFWGRSTQRVIQRPIKLAYPGNLLEMPTLRSSQTFWMRNSGARTLWLVFSQIFHVISNAFLSLGTPVLRCGTKILY